MSGNPYNRINMLAFPLRKILDRDDSEIFLFRPDPVSHPAFDVCVFRDHLSRFLLDEMANPFNMSSGDVGILLEVSKGFDSVRLREEFNAR
jgi:hypothetical protein